MPRVFFNGYLFMWCFDSFFFDVGAFWMFSCVFLPAVSTLSPGCVLQMWPAGGSSSINSASLSIDLSSGETWRFLPPVLSQLVFVQKTAWGGAFPACCDNKTSSTIFFLHINCSASQPTSRLQTPHPSAEAHKAEASDSGTVWRWNTSADSEN